MPTLVSCIGTCWQTGVTWGYVGVEMLGSLQHYKHVPSVVRVWHMRSSALCGWTNC